MGNIWINRSYLPKNAWVDDHPPKGAKVDARLVPRLRGVLPIFILFFAAAAGAQPYITPYQPDGWADKVVVTTNPNSTADTSTLYTTNVIYVDWAVINSGNATANTTCYVDLYTNSVYVESWAVESLPPGGYEYVADPGFEAGEFPAGTNTIELVADATDVYETPPSTYTKTFTVLAPALPSLSAPVLISPANGSTNQSTSAVFTWSAVSNAASYEIIVATNAADLPANTTATSGGASVAIAAGVTNATTYTPVNPLDPGTTYYWEVNARYLSEGGPWSSTWRYTTANPPPGLTILPVWDSTITSDPQATTIENTIRAAIAVYQSDFSDPMTVSITFEEMSGGLGESSWSYNTYSYSAYRAALVAAATTPDDSTALAHLPIQTDNPVNNNASVNVKTALAWAVGLNSGTSGENVGTVLLQTSIMNLSDAQTDPSKYSLFSTACHEIDEVLATGSALDEVYRGEIAATGPVFPEDLFRYDPLGDRSYTTNITATSYFSLDGTNDLAQFNQVGSGDFGDWYSYYGGVVPQVQDAFATPGASPNPGVELRALDVLGYHLVTQEPAPNFVSATRSGNTIVLVWTAVSGNSYQLLYSTNLALSVWNNLGGSLTASNSTASYTDSIGPSQQRFYRVELLPSSGESVRFNRSQVVTPPTGWGTNVFRPYP
ncbi:MAG TPA: NF038122 family metalloprotease [Verrucomicrobiae bacterium]|nr:NF038122 family metalloprotease [Verrucomicrobiae bacterium]